MLNNNLILGYSQAVAYPEYSKTNMGYFALVKVGAPVAIRKLYLGATQLSNLYLGSTKINAVYLGSTPVLLN